MPASFLVLLALLTVLLRRANLTGAVTPAVYVMPRSRVVVLGVSLTPRLARSLTRRRVRGGLEVTNADLGEITSLKDLAALEKEVMVP